MADDPRAAAIVRSTIELAHSLGMTMVAEGVEDEYTAAQLALSSCDTVQGFYFSKALPGRSSSLDGRSASRTGVAVRPCARRSAPVTVTAAGAADTDAWPENRGSPIPTAPPPRSRSYTGGSALAALADEIDALAMSCTYR